MHYVALLRGINVGGNNKLPMKDLAAMFERAGCESVQTYIQSGNVVFGASSALAAKIGTVVAARILAESGMTIPIVVRSATQLRKTVRENPFLAKKIDIEQLHVVFLSAPPKAPHVGALDPARSAPDAFIVRGAEIFLHCPNGYGRSKLTNAYFDGKLSLTSTVRNWRTVVKLLELVDAPGR